jgi:acid phosphatase type 7
MNARNGDTHNDGYFGLKEPPTGATDKPCRACPCRSWKMNNIFAHIVAVNDLAQTRHYRSLSVAPYSQPASERKDYCPPILRLPAILIFVAIFSLTLRASADPRHIYLTYSDAPETSIDINIIADRKTERVDVYYDEVSRNAQQAEYRRTAEARYIESPMELADGRALYVAQLRGLKPGSTYHFMAGDAAYGYSHERSFRTLPGGNAPIRFVNGGDMGMDNRAIGILREAAKHDPDFAVIGGDLAYANGLIGNDDLWDAWFDNWDTFMRRSDGAMVPLITCIGNHEVNKAAFTEPELRSPWYLPLFGRQGEELYYTRAVGENMVFVILDSGYHNPFGGNQAAWLDKALAVHKNVPHKFAVYHMPLYPAFSDYNGSRRIEARAAWGPLFDAHGLRVAFEHDDHVAKRSKALKNNIVDETGTVYIGDGAFGRESRNIDRELRWYNAMEESVVHFWLVDVDKDTVKLQAIDRKGKVFDSLTLP